MLLHYLLWQRRCLGAKPDSTTLDKNNNKKQKTKTKSGKKGKEKDYYICVSTCPRDGAPEDDLSPACGECFFSGRIAEIFQILYLYYEKLLRYVGEIQSCNVSGIRF